MILITRPLENAYKTLGKIKAIGLNGKVFPLLKIEFDKSAIKQVDFKSFDIVVITSQNINKVLKTFQITFDNSILVVGERNAQLLEESGFNVLAYEPTVTDLLAYVTEKVNPSKKLLYLSGDHIANQLDTKLVKLGFNIERIIIYSSIAFGSMPKETLNDIDKILFYSPRTAKVFSELCHDDLSLITAICISKNTAFMLNNLKFKDIVIAKSATEESMFSLLK